MKQQVNVIIPVYNGARYLTQAVESVLGQDFRPKTIFIIDDGSTDETAIVARSFGGLVDYHYQQNAGAATARNLGISLAQDDYVAFLDADDYWESSKLTKQIAALDADPQLEMVFGHTRYFISPDLAPDAAAKLFCPPEPMPGVLPSTMLVKRKVFERVGLFETQWQIGEFVSWCAQARELGVTELMLPDTVAARRLHDANQGVTKRDAMRDYLYIVKAARDRRRKASGT